MKNEEFDMMEFRQKQIKTPDAFLSLTACCSASPCLYESKLSTANANHFNSVADTTLRKPSSHKPAFGDKPLRLGGALASSATTQGGM